MQALDLAQHDWKTSEGTWHAGPSATTLLPHATALAHYFR